VAAARAAAARAAAARATEAAARATEAAAKRVVGSWATAVETVVETAAET
jgi:hypothetical protein